MKLTWMAHSCFNIILENGTKIVFDPFDNTIGYELPVLEADIALISHDHFDHNDVSRLSGDYTLIREAGEYTVGDVKIRGIKTYHDPEQGALRGENVVFIVEAEGIRIAHLGDLGEMPQEEFYKELGKIDILLIPVDQRRAGLPDLPQDRPEHHHPDALQDTFAHNTARKCTEIPY